MNVSILNRIRDERESETTKGEGIEDEAEVCRRGSKSEVTSEGGHFKDRRKYRKDRESKVLQVEIELSRGDRSRPRHQSWR